jgi:uncharacterized protein (TIGR00730 family)
MAKSDEPRPTIPPPADVITTPEEILQVVGQAVLGLWDVVNNLTRLRPGKMPHYHVTIFGSARIQPATAVYEDVRRLARVLAERGCQIVTGGGPGLMAAANEGAAEGDPTDKLASIGIRIDLPFEQGVNPFVGQVYHHKTFFTRLHHFVLVSDAFVVVPGGLGTLLELAMIWQLLQVRNLHDTPLILVGPMWTGLVDWATEGMTRGQPKLADDVDMTIPTCVTTMDEAIALICKDHARWLKQNKKKR